MRISIKTLLTLALALLACSPSAAGGYRRGSYGGGRRVSGTSRQVVPTANYNNGGAPTSYRAQADGSGYATQGAAQVRGRGSVGYGNVQSSSGYGSMSTSRGIGRGFGGGAGGSRRMGSIRSAGTRYDMAPADGGGPAPADPAPVQGFAVPGALIRTAGIGFKTSAPSQPEREFAIAAGKPEVQSNLSYNETNHAGLYKIAPDKAPTPNPGWGSSGASGGNGATPNSSLIGTGGTVFGGQGN